MFLIIFLLGSCFVGCDEVSQTKYLRIHVRANSNTQADQDIKYEVKDLIVGYLEPKLKTVQTVDGAIQLLNNEKSALNGLIGGFLAEKGFDYGAQVKIVNEYFPTRAYDDFVLSGGYYDAVIVELGSGKGDNWWCVVYPPLCFTKKGVTYKSIIAEYLEKLFG